MISTGTRKSQVSGQLLLNMSNTSPNSSTHILTKGWVEIFGQFHCLRCSRIWCKTRRIISLVLSFPNNFAYTSRVWTRGNQRNSHMSKNAHVKPYPQVFYRPLWFFYSTMVQCLPNPLSPPDWQCSKHKLILDGKRKEKNKRNKRSSNSDLWVITHHSHDRAAYANLLFNEKYY